LRPGDIVVVDRMGDQRHACWGGGVTIAAKAAGALAGVVDGPCTDLSEIQESDFPVWSRGISPITTRLYNLGGGLNIPVSCGGVPVLPGDVVLADESGVLVLRRDEAEAIAPKRCGARQTAPNVKLPCGPARNSVSSAAPAQRYARRCPPGGDERLHTKTTFKRKGSPITHAAPD